MQNSIIAIEEKSSGLFTADSNVSIINTDNKSLPTMLTPSAGRLFLCAVPVHQHLKNFHSRTLYHYFRPTKIRQNTST